MKNSQELNIEWKHIGAKGKTCIRCNDTGKTLKQVISGLKKEFSPQGINVTYTETILPTAKVKQSNMVLFNGIPLEKLIKAKVSKSCCPSCCSFTKEETFCRTIKYKGKIYEAIPEEIIQKAARKAIKRGK